MKTYTFCVHNWKSGNRAFWLRKSFSSAYIADRWAMKLSFGSKNSPYMVVFIPGKEF